MFAVPAADSDVLVGELIAEMLAGGMRPSWADLPGSGAALVGVEVVRPAVGEIEL
ncbi:hypothetical protein [Chitinimonas lacunae]|uniref:Uncharacterized protein n=1 Tax=Chitinimonas lacunae TaxID=1963018 RepID=A0ABV8MLU2_9NEIS